MAELAERSVEAREIEERTCNYTSICKRDGEVVQREEGVIYVREASADDSA